MTLQIPDIPPSLAEFCAPGVALDEVPGLSGLLAARTLLDTFITLFRGGEDEVLIRLHVLREIGGRAAAPRWTPAELQSHFVYLNPVKLETVLKRLRDNALLNWDVESGTYQLSQPGRTALAALSTLLNFAVEPEAELGYLTSQVAAGQAVGKVSREALEHLLARLNELHLEFEDALESQSEFRIRAAQERLGRVERWVQRATAVVKTLSDSLVESDDIDAVVFTAVQAVGLAQSRLLNLTGSFQRRLAQLQQQRVHLGQSGLTSTDLAAFLRDCKVPALLELGGDGISVAPDLLFVSTPELADKAEYELVDRERPEAEAAVLLPSLVEATAQSAPEAERLLAAEAWLSRLTEVSDEARLSEVVVASDYAHTAYRMSLLALLGDPETAAESSVVAQLAKLPLRLETIGDMETIDHPQVAGISIGSLQPLYPVAAAAVEAGGAGSVPAEAAAAPDLTDAAAAPQNSV